MGDDHISTAATAGVHVALTLGARSAARPRFRPYPPCMADTRNEGKGEKRPASAREAMPAIEVVEPVGKRVLIRKDEDKKITKGGVHLPDKIEIPTLTGRVVTVSAEVARNEDYPIQQYDRVLFNPKHAIPVDFEGDNRLFVVPIEDVVAVFRKS